MPFRPVERAEFIQIEHSLSTFELHSFEKPGKPTGKYKTMLERAKKHHMNPLIKRERLLVDKLSSVNQPEIDDDSAENYGELSKKVFSREELAFYFKENWSLKDKISNFLHSLLRQIRD